MSLDRWKKTGRTLGEGGQAQVFVVTDSDGEFDGELALKVLKNRQRTGRIDLEISTTKSLARSGCAVVPILDDYTEYGDDSVKPWYVMPKADGGNLEDHIIRGQVYGGSEEAALTTFGEIAAVVQSLHENGVAHRDIKPANILIASNRILLCDLGLCLPLAQPSGENRLTGSLERIGSLHYIPKEAFGRHPVDRAQFALDAYAMGKILYVLLAGEVLPGFTSPNDPKYDLLASRDFPLYAGVNALLRGLLHDDVQKRIKVLETLGSQIQGLIEWSQGADDNDAEASLPARLVLASEAVARNMDSASEKQSKDPLKTECEEMAKQVMKVFEQSSAIEHVEKSLVANSEHLNLHRSPSSRKLRELVSGPYVKTHHGIEPFEDRGYPTKPSSEAGCAIGVVANNDAANRVPQIWVGCLVAGAGGMLHAAVSIAMRESGISAYADLLGKATNVYSGTEDDSVFVKSVIEDAQRVAVDFAELITTEYSSLGDKPKRR